MIGYTREKGLSYTYDTGIECYQRGVSVSTEKTSVSFRRTSCPLCWLDVVLRPLNKFRYGGSYGEEFNHARSLYLLDFIAF